LKNRKKSEKDGKSANRENQQKNGKKNYSRFFSSEENMYIFFVSTIKPDLLSKLVTFIINHKYFKSYVSAKRESVCLKYEVVP